MKRGRTDFAILIVRVSFPFKVPCYIVEATASILFLWNPGEI